MCVCVFVRERAMGEGGEDRRRGKETWIDMKASIAGVLTMGILDISLVTLCFCFWVCVRVCVCVCVCVSVSRKWSF